MAYTKQQKMLIASIVLLICGSAISLFAWGKVSLAGNAALKSIAWNGGWRTEYDGSQTWRGLGAKYQLTVGLMGMAAGGIVFTLYKVKKDE